MRIELNGLQLDCEEEDGEGRSVTNISTVESRNTAAYDSPGGQSSTFGDLGRGAVKITLEGLVSGKNGPALLEGIWACFKRGDPVEFNSDLTGAADITKVLIDSMVVRSAAGNKNRYDYSLELLEYREPPEEPEGPGAGEAGEGGEAGEESEGSGSDTANDEAQEWADKVAGDTATGRNDLTGNVLDADGKPAKGVTVIISGQGQEIEVQTGDSGEYSISDLAPGYYKVTAGDSEAQYVAVGMESRPEAEDDSELRAIEAELKEIEAAIKSLESEIKAYATKAKNVVNALKSALSKARALRDKLSVLLIRLSGIKGMASKVKMVTERIKAAINSLENVIITFILDKIKEFDVSDIVMGTDSGEEEPPAEPDQDTSCAEEPEPCAGEEENYGEEVTGEENEESVVEEVVDAVGDAAGDAADAVGDAAGGAVDAAEEAIEDLFGWDEEEEE